MVSKFAILANILLASVVLAVPPYHSRLEARLVRRHENRQSQAVQRVDAPAGSVSNGAVGYSSNWAGASYDLSNGTFTTVTATITLPTPAGFDNGSASAWVGLDGDSCPYAILQTGVDVTVTNGQVLYAVWYEFYPDYAYDFDGIPLSAGDKIKATVIASSTTSGIAIIENLTTGKTVKKVLTSKVPLCGQNAEWIVEDYSVGDSTVPFANFGTYNFTNASASGPSGRRYTPDGATTILNIMQNKTIFTSTSTSRDTMTVKYVKTEV